MRLDRPAIQKRPLGESLEGRVLLTDGTASIYGRVFRDWNRNGLHDSAHELFVSHVVYVDANNNARRDAGELQTTSSAKGSYQFNHLAAGSYRLRIDGPDDLVITPPAPIGKVVHVADGQALTTANIGTTFASTVLGRVYLDEDADGKRDSNEDDGIARRAVWVDLDGDAIFDAGTEPFARTNSIGRYQIKDVYSGTYFVRVVLANAEFQTSPIRGRAAAVSVSGASSGAIADFLVTPPATAFFGGTVFDDLNDDHQLSSGEAVRAGITLFLDRDNDGLYDKGESRQLTDSAGRYRFGGLFEATYRIGVVTPAGRRIDGGSSFDFRANGSLSLNLALSLKSKLSGRVQNNLIAPDAQDTGVSNVTVFADLNRDGVRQQSEPSDVTGSLGFWDFLLPPTGTYTVRIEPRAGNTFLSPTNGVRTITFGELAEQELQWFKVLVT